MKHTLNIVAIILLVIAFNLNAAEEKPHQGTTRYQYATYKIIQTTHGKKTSLTYSWKTPNKFIEASTLSGDLTREEAQKKFHKDIGIERTKNQDITDLINHFAKDGWRYKSTTDSGESSFMITMYWFEKEVKK